MQMPPNTHILLTGGTGFFGKALLRFWIDSEIRGHLPPRVTILSRMPDRFAVENPTLTGHPWLNWVKGDVCNPITLPRQDAFTHVLHAATDSTLGPQMDPLSRYDQIVQGTRNMLDFALAVGAKRFLLTSSGGVYGPQPYGMERIPEGYHGMPDSLRPANAYSVAKRAAEHLCALYQDKHGLECVIARCFAFVGTDLPLNIHFAIGNFIRDALYRDSITVAGDGTAVRSYLDQRDLAHWLLTLLDKGQSGRAYNVGSDQAITIANLADQVSELLSPGKPVYILGKAAFSGARSRYVPDISRARVELGLDVTIPLGEAIRVTAEASQL
jgi:UDP-glucuronate decarboxylase